jgi:DNA-binding transcriptional LysR family regulator
VELRHLRYFLAVAEELSFTRAAQRLYIGQPNLSQQIRALEKVVGIPLFDRQPSGVRLTAAGEALVEPARRALSSVQEAVQAARETAGAVDSVLRVGLLQVGAAELTTPILTAFTRAFPSVQLRFWDLIRPADYSDLLEARIDVALARLPLDPDRFAWTVLFSEPRILGVSSHHPLAAADAVEVTDILDLPMANVGPKNDIGICAYWTLDDYRNGEPPPIRGEIASTLSETAHAIAYSDIISVGPESIRRMQLPVGDSIRLLTLRNTSNNAVVVARRRADRRLVTRAFCETAAAVARELGPIVLPHHSTVPIVS